tara:strand:+ start:244 stop:423 length:180 start_codon:yes stop_codon:yes gene_type:complete
VAYLGFKKLKKNIQSQGKSPAAAGAIAANIGRKKYGNKAMARAAAAGKKLRGMKSKGSY